MNPDLQKPLLRLGDAEPVIRLPGHGGDKPSRTFSPAEQRGKFGPKFTRLAAALRRNNPNISFNRDPDGLAPERLLVFEVTGSVTDFYKAVERVEGLTFAAEDALEDDGEDTNPEMYLVMPDMAALRQILSLWQLWQGQDKLPRGFAPWGHLFERLRSIRRWGPADRVRPLDRSVLLDAAEAVGPGGRVRLEVELVFLRSDDAAGKASEDFRAALAAAGGILFDEARHAAFSYHAFLIDLSSEEVIQIANLAGDSLAGMDAIFSITPQSLSSEIVVGELEDAEPIPPAEVVNDPIVAVFDAVPLQAHPWIAPWLSVVDPDGLENLAVGQRAHGTAMASIAIHGDRNAVRPPIGRRIYFRCVMYAPPPGPAGQGRERFPDDKLIVDLIVEAVEGMRQNGGQSVIVVNLSLGDSNRRFSDRISAWARALDYLAKRHGLLFVVASGNVGDQLPLADFPAGADFESATNDERERGIFTEVDRIKADRRLLSPAESLNALTVGAWHADGLEPIELPAGRYFAYTSSAMPNVSSALGHGHRRAVKPDILLPGGREQLILRPAATPATLSVNGSGTRFGGIRVAVPPQPGQANDQGGFTIGSSASAAFATHTAHRAYDELEREYGEVFSNLPFDQKAVLLKAIVAHPADWRNTDAFIEAIKFPTGGQWDMRRREIARHLGYGFVNPDEAISCAGDRATLWATGTLADEQAVEFSIPVPDGFSQSDDRRAIKATLAWFSSVRPGHQMYRASKLRIVPLSQGTRVELGVNPAPEPPWQQTEIGTLIHRRWSGTAFGQLGTEGAVVLHVQREKDQGGPTDEAVPFGLVVTVEMPERPGIYEEILARVPIRPQSLVAA